ncbi:WD40 repeat domain-containing protein [Streptomyces sp. NPDC013953]|uniref:WD40 repeat domain-containing protein n=1 Tax=Streptomyces sp. NPDC013953 TaxID=3364868 RepID=UPI0036FF2F48
MTDRLRESGGGRADAWSVPPEVLVHEESDRVRALLEGQADGSQLPVAVYETSGHVHRHATAGVRQQLLALDACRYGQPQLAARVSEVPVGRPVDVPWVVRWATGTDLDGRLRYSLPVPAKAGVVATVVTAGRGIAVAGCDDGTLHRWDLATGRRLGEALTGHSGAVGALAAAVVDGRPVAVTGGSDTVVRLWDLLDGEQVGEFPAGDDAWVWSLATGLVQGRPVAVGGSGDGMVRVWDLATRTQRGGPLAGHTGAVVAVATSEVDGRPVAVTGGGDGTVRVWDLITGGESGSRTGPDEVRLVATYTDPAYDHPIHPMAVSADEGEVRIWNLATGEQAGEPLAVRFVTALAAGRLGGRPAALVARSLQGPVEVWDLSTRRHLRPSLIGHERNVRAVALAAVRGRHLAVTGGDDGSVRIWDLVGEGEAGELLTGHAGMVELLTVGMVDGRLTLLTRDRHETVRIWDLAAREQLHGRTTREWTSPGIRLFAVLDGRFVAVDSGGRVWDLTAGEWIGVPPQQAGPLALDTLEGRTLVLTGCMEETVCLWDMATGERWGSSMAGHGSPVRSGAVGMLDGRVVVATGGGDGTVRVWDAATGRQTGTYAFPSRVTSLAMSGDGRLVAAFGSDIAVLDHLLPLRGRPCHGLSH